MKRPALPISGSVFYEWLFGHEKFSDLSRNRPPARVSRSKVSANQRQLPSKRIAFDTSKPMICANLAGSRRGMVRGDRNCPSKLYFQR